MPEIFFRETDGVGEVMADQFHELVENDVFAGEPDIVVRIRAQLLDRHDIRQKGRACVVECLNHDIVADVIAVEMRLDQAVHRRSHEFAEGTARDLMAVGLDLFKNLVDLALQIQTVTVFEENLFPE